MVQVPTEISVRLTRISRSNHQFSFASAHHQREESEQFERKPGVVGPLILGEAAMGEQPTSPDQISSAFASTWACWLKCAVAQLLFRGLKKLRELLGSVEDS
jgi:hypothetical protein